MPDDAVEKRRQANRESYQRNREKRLEKNRQWREANPDKMKAYNRDWYAKNWEHAQEKNRAWRAANPERMRELLRQWYEQNKTKIAEDTRLQRTGCTPDQYRDLLMKQDGLCAICNQPPGKHALAADHCHTTGIIRGLLCITCNTMLGLSKDNPAILRAAATYLENAVAAET